MTQFASTLYPQTNPTNPILCEYRFFNETAGLNPGMTRDTPQEWLGYTERCYQVVTLLDLQHVDHARRVLTRLASFSG